MLFLVHRCLSCWWLRCYVPPKCRFLQEPHGVTSQKTAFFSIVVGITICYPDQMDTKCTWMPSVTYQPRSNGHQVHLNALCHLSTQIKWTPSTLEFPLSPINPDQMDTKYTWIPSVTYQSEYGQFDCGNSIKRCPKKFANVMMWEHCTFADFLMWQSSLLWRMLSSEMLCSVALLRTNVLEECTASIIRVTRIGEQGTMIAVSRNQSMPWRNTIWQEKRQYGIPDWGWREECG
jgi:hypothetical protein